MNIHYSFISAVIIPLLLAAHVILEFRLHDEYRDYRVHLPRRCHHCAAISTELSSRYRMPTPWYSVKSYQASPVPWWLRLIYEGRDTSGGDYGDKKCCHAMLEFFMPNNKNDIVLSDPTDYLLPARFHQVRNFASWLLILFVAAIPIHVVCYWALKRTGGSCTGASVTVRTTLFCSLAAVTASFLFPVGTPITQRLDEYRRVTSQVKRTDGKTCDWRRIGYLLSDNAVRDCETCTIRFRYPGRKYSTPEYEALFLFPRNYLKQAQIRLAIAAAPYNSHLACGFFYGSSPNISDDWATLTKRLDERLIKRDSAYPAWAMRGGPGADRLDTIIAAHMSHELVIRTVSTNRCGTVNVVWCGSELPKVEYLTLYGQILSEGSSFWVPLRTVASAERFPIGYLFMTQILMW